MADPCQTRDCGHSYEIHRARTLDALRQAGCLVTDCPCDEYREDPPGSGADPWGRTMEDVMRSAE